MNKAWSTLPTPPFWLLLLFKIVRPKHIFTNELQIIFMLNLKLILLQIAYQPIVNCAWQNAPQKKPKVCGITLEDPGIPARAPVTTADL